MNRWATFDCYGTLIDWNGGIGAELVRLWPDLEGARLFAEYHDVEPRIQRGDPGLSYRDVLRLSLEEVARRLGRSLPDHEAGALGASLPAWPVFPEVPGELAEAAQRGWKLAILSNTDRDFIEASKANIGVAFDETVVASEIGSYKPEHKHWDEFFARTKADRTCHVHVAASLFHDIAPARELGLTSVWINRLGEHAQHSPTRELPDLRGLADVLDELVPA